MFEGASKGYWVFSLCSRRLAAHRKRPVSGNASCWPLTNRNGSIAGTVIALLCRASIFTA